MDKRVSPSDLSRDRADKLSPLTTSWPYPATASGAQGQRLDRQRRTDAAVRRRQNAGVGDKQVSPAMVLAESIHDRCGLIVAHATRAGNVRRVEDVVRPLLLENLFDTRRLQ